MSQQHAKVALDLISRVNVAASDETLSLTMQTRAMLHNIANGRLVVVPPDQVRKPKKPKVPA